MNANPHKFQAFVVGGETFDEKKAQIGNNQEKAQSERDSHSKNRGGNKKTKLIIKYPYNENTL